MRFSLTALVTLGTTLFTTAAFAQNALCFRPTNTNLGASTHTSTGPGSRFETSPDCRYTVRVRGENTAPPTRALQPGPRDVAEFITELGAPPARLAADLEVIASRASQPDTIETLSLRPCLTRLGEGNTVVRFDPQPTANTFRLTSTADLARCPVSDAEIVLVPNGSDSTTLTQAPPSARTLSLTSTDHTDLPTDIHPWSVYLRRHGSPSALRIDVLTLGDPRTPLQRRFATPITSPWFRADFSQGTLRLSPTDLSTTDLPWAELVTAAATQAVFIAGPDAPDGAPTFTLPITPRGTALSVPDAVVHSVMQSHYGRVGNSLVPARPDWSRVLSTLRLCHRGTYAAEPVHSARMLPSELSALHCLSLSQITTPATAPSFQPLTLARRMDVLQRRDTVSVSQSSTTDTEDLPLDSSTTVHFVTPGDTLTAPNTLPDGHILSLCPVSSSTPTDNTTTISLRAGEQFTFTPTHAGLWQIVSHPDSNPRCSTQDLSLARIAVISPRTDWLPVGLHEHGPMDLTNPWAALQTSGNDTFAFHRRSGLPEFRLSTTEDVTSAINSATPSSSDNSPNDTPRITRSLPVRLRVEAPVNTPPSALTVLLTTRDACPDSELDLVPNLRALPSESTLYAFLAQEHSVGTPKRFTCLARARLRVIPPLVHHGVTSGPFYLRWGLPGSVSLRAHYEVSGTCTRAADCFSFGLAVPVLYARASLDSAPWMTLEASIPLVFSVSPGDARALHTGLGLDLGLSFGPRILPRFITVGLLFQPRFLSVGTENHSSIVNLAPYLGVNLSSIIDAIRSE